MIHGLTSGIPALASARRRFLTDIPACLAASARCTPARTKRTPSAVLGALAGPFSTSSAGASKMASIAAAAFLSAASAIISSALEFVMIISFSMRTILCTVSGQSTPDTSGDKLRDKFGDKLQENPTNVSRGQGRLARKASCTCLSPIRGQLARDKISAAGGPQVIEVTTVVQPERSGQDRPCAWKATGPSRPSEKELALHPSDCRTLQPRHRESVKSSGESGVASRWRN